jgi:hypothetical protein
MIFLTKTVNDTTLAIIAIVAAVGLLGLVVMESTILPQQQQQAFAARPPFTGWGSTPGFNASQQRCFHG